MEQTNLTLVRGDTWPLEFEARNATTGAIYDITGSTWWLTVKTLITDVDSSAIYQAEWSSHSDPTNGKTTLSIANTITANFVSRDYAYDVQMKTQTGDIHTVAKGTLTVEPDVTITATPTTP